MGVNVIYVVVLLWKETTEKPQNRLTCNVKFIDM